MIAVANYVPFLSAFGGILAAVVAFMLLKADSAFSKWRKGRAIKRESSVIGVESRVKVLEEQYKYLYDAMKEVLQFIKGSEDPFTKEITGGLLAFMARIEDRLPELKDKG